MSETVTQKLMFFFPRCECEKPIIYHLVKDYDLVVNVFSAKVTPEEEGYLVLDVTGSEAHIQQAIEYVKTYNVSVNVTGKGVVRDPERCTHCGHCITHCPTKALRIDNPGTREVMYHETECIECLACIRVCPYGACSSTF